MLSLIIIILGSATIGLGVCELYVSLNLGDLKNPTPWAADLWALFANSGLMLLPHLYSIMDFVVGSIFIFCGYLILKVKHMEFAALTAFATGLVALFVYGIGDWWTYVARVKYEGLAVMYLRVILQGAVPIIASALSLTAQRQEAKTLMGRRIRSFWEDFSHNKIGLVGMAILFTYIIAAVLVPVLSLGINPEQTDLADELVPPSWIDFFYPSLRNLPRTLHQEYNWTDYFVTIPESIKDDPNVNWSWDGQSFIFNISGLSYNESAPFRISLETVSQYYPYDPPRGGGFIIGFILEVDPHQYYSPSEKIVRAFHNVELNMTSPVNTTNLWDAEWYYKRQYYYSLHRTPMQKVLPFNLSSAETRLMKSKINETFQLTSDLYWCHKMGFVDEEGAVDWHSLSKALFPQPGNYSYQMYFYINATATYSRTTGETTIYPIYYYAKIKPIFLDVKGMLHGIMGTDHLGRDIWSRIVHGIKISLAIGLASAVASSFIGVMVGVVAGYLGGTVDELLMRLVDILLCLPVLPLLIVLVYMYGQNVWYIVILIAVFGWQGLSRVIRSQVLSLREASFVECATASGASRTYIMIRHLIPNVLPIVLADFVLSVPGGIMTEAGLSFIGFGDPTTPTWGREFNIMWTEGGAFAVFAWWWFVPPAIAITVLCLAFVFLGHAVDEIVNPRLRRRR
ncbi:MAG: ABC transporter permease [Candidatus Bathyarchaeia archaeon]